MMEDAARGFAEQTAATMFGEMDMRFRREQADAELKGVA
jgi:hypothetical protein